MFRAIAAVAVAAFLSSCGPDAANKPAAGAPAPAATPPAAGGEKAPAAPAGASVTPTNVEKAVASIPGADSIKAASPDAAKAIETAAETEKAAAAAAADVQETAAEAQKTAEEIQKQVAAAADPATTVDGVKGLLGSLNGDGLKSLGDKLMAALQNQDGVVAGLKDQISKLGLGDLGKVAELKKSLESATTLYTGLKEKLGLVVDKMKASGLDVSKYTSFLGK